MKILLSITLLAAILMGYYLVGSLVGSVVDTPVSSFGFSETSPEIRRLDSFKEYQVISGKPLFAADREPLIVKLKKKTIQQRPVQTALSVQALGIAVTGESILAVIKDLKNNKIIRLRINQEIYGWTLKGVSADSFVFSKGKTEKTIKFKSNGD